MTFGPINCVHVFGEGMFRGTCGVIRQDVEPHFAGGTCKLHSGRCSKSNHGATTGVFDSGVFGYS